jgi:hypothetical protein
MPRSSRDYILPLIFLKRLCDVFDDEIAHLAHDFGDAVTAAKLVKQDHKLVRFYILDKARWAKIAATTTGLGQFLTDAVRPVARENPRLSGVIDVTDFNATAAGHRIVDDQHLANLVQVLNNPQYRLGLDDVEPDILGRAYEYLLRKFAEGQGQSACEFYTPREIGVLIGTPAGPASGHDGLRSVLRLGRLAYQMPSPAARDEGKRENRRMKLPASVSPLKVHGQEINASTFAMPDERLHSRHGSGDRARQYDAEARIHCKTAREKSSSTLTKPTSMRTRARSKPRVGPGSPASNTSSPRILPPQDYSLSLYQAPGASKHLYDKGVIG